MGCKINKTQLVRVYRMKGKTMEAHLQSIKNSVSRFQQKRLFLGSWGYSGKLLEENTHTRTTPPAVSLQSLTCSLVTSQITSAGSHRLRLAWNPDFMGCSQVSTKKWPHHCLNCCTDTIPISWKWRQEGTQSCRTVWDLIQVSWPCWWNSYFSIPPSEANKLPRLPKGENEKAQLTHQCIEILLKGFLFCPVLFLWFSTRTIHGSQCLSFLKHFQIVAKWHPRTHLYEPHTSLIMVTNVLFQSQCFELDGGMTNPMKVPQKTESHQPMNLRLSP